MLNFNVNPIHEKIEKEVAVYHEWVDAITKHAVEADRMGDIPKAFWHDVDASLMNKLFVPKKYGGFLAMEDALARSIICEEFGYGDIAMTISMCGPSLSASPIMALGSQEQQEKIFSHFNSVEPVWGSFAITEPESGSDAAGMLTTATKTANGYILNGKKRFIGNGSRAKYTIVFATTDPSKGRFGVKAFYVEKGTPGFSLEQTEDMLGLRCIRQAFFSFDHCGVPESSLLMDPDSGIRMLDSFGAAIKTWDSMRPMLASLFVGSARRSRDIFTHYIQSKENTKLSHKQLNEIVLDMDGKINSARLLAYKAAWRRNQDLPMAKDASIAKYYASKIAMEIIEQIMDLLGLETFVEEPMLEKLYRDAKAFEILEGTSDIQQLMITNAHRQEKHELSRLAI